MAGVTGLEPATSGVTGRRSNQLSYTPVARAPRGGLILCLPGGVNPAMRGNGATSSVPARLAASPAFDSESATRTFS